METIRGRMQLIGGYLRDDAVRIIGIYGMGGVGKTTLLQMINNTFSEIGAPRFEVVIWVTVSKDADILKIQKSISDKLCLSSSAEEASSSSSQAKVQALAIFKALSRRRFLLLLEDVWEELDRERVGIPEPTVENKCKIILTTRSRQVCHDMGAVQLVNVEVLNESKSWELFKKKAGTQVENPTIKPIAEAVAGKCGGLPLALITVGCAMAEARSVGEWQEALKQLEESPHALPGVEKKVLSFIKFSFNRLGDETTKECLLYCCLFPEGYNIPVDQVIDYWVGEGFLDTAQSYSIIRARDRGRVVITSLKSACLPLESKGGSFVKMHDVVREMCVWLTGGEYDKNNTFSVHARRTLSHIPPSENWKVAKRISLMNCVLKEGQRGNVTSCPNLRTLLCCSTPLSEIQQGFINSLHRLRVLDLSYTGLASLPVDISFLEKLQYLNLEATDISSLPECMAMLANLRHLNLDFTRSLSYIPPVVTPILMGLQALSLYDSGYDFVWLNEPSVSPLDDNSAIQREGTSSSSSPPPTRYSWDKLEELRLSVRTLSSLLTLLNSDELCQHTMALKIDAIVVPDITPEHLSRAFQRLEKLRSLDVQVTEVKFNRGIKCGSSLEKLYLNFINKIAVETTSPPLFGSLRILVIVECDGIHDRMWVRLLPCLKEINISIYMEMKELIPKVDGMEDVDRSSLLALRELHLHDLPGLESVSPLPMLLPSLELIWVNACPDLKKLPLGSGSPVSRNCGKG